jgi:vancomycin resistance protein VanW
MSSLSRSLRPLVPLGLRRWISLRRRSWRDKGDALDVALEETRETCTDWSTVACVTQPLIQAPNLDEKRANLAKAIGLMDGLIIRRGQTLSIWECLGAPTSARGWASGRTIINDVVTTDPGGGLCQLSSLIYHLGLLAGLTMIERHHHSRDIHRTDATRFTALGLDATIFYGFKDLRMRNDGADKVVLRFGLMERELSGSILTPRPQLPRLLHTQRYDHRLTRSVVVSYVGLDGALELISDDHYLL